MTPTLTFSTPTSAFLPDPVQLRNGVPQSRRRYPPPRTGRETVVSPLRPTYTISMSATPSTATLSPRTWTSSRRAVASLKSSLSIGSAPAGNCRLASVSVCCRPSPTASRSSSQSLRPPPDGLFSNKISYDRRFHHLSIFRSANTVASIPIRVFFRVNRLPLNICRGKIHGDHCFVQVLWHRYGRDKNQFFRPLHVCGADFTGGV